MYMTTQNVNSNDNAHAHAHVKRKRAREWTCPRERNGHVHVNLHVSVNVHLRLYVAGVCRRFMGASACRCSCVSPASALQLLQLLACKYPTSPWPSRTELLGRPSCDRASSLPSDKLSSSSTKFFPMSFVPGVEGALPPSSHAKFLPVRPGVWLPPRTPLSFGRTCHCTCLRKLFSIGRFSEFKPHGLPLTSLPILPLPFTAPACMAPHRL